MASDGGEGSKIAEMRTGGKRRDRKETERKILMCLIAKGRVGETI